MATERAKISETCAFLIVTPLGLGRAAELGDALALCRVTVCERACVTPWSYAATHLYLRSFDEVALARAQRFEARWRALFPDDRAELWTLPTHQDYERLLASKAVLRRRFRGVPLAAPRAGEPAFELHAFHVPDREDLAGEALRVERCIAQQPVV